eukprot:9426185-Alexandrium_andersonii.AAC.1
MERASAPQHARFTMNLWAGTIMRRDRRKRCPTAAAPIRRGAAEARTTPRPRRPRPRHQGRRSAGAG